MDENAGGTLYKRNKKNKAAWAGAVLVAASAAIFFRVKCVSAKARLRQQPVSFARSVPPSRGFCATGNAVSHDTKRKDRHTRKSRYHGLCPCQGVPAAGLEPARCRHQWILSPPRLPFRQAGAAQSANVILSEINEKSKCFSIFSSETF